MAGKKRGPSEDPPASTTVPGPRPRLRRLRISNFRAIGPVPVEIELDDIVVLVGPNNSGKSSILRAYEVVMLDQSKEGQLTSEDFPDGKPDPSRLPTIELETVVTEANKPGDQWVKPDPETGELVVLERWCWGAPGQATRVGFDVGAGKWHDKSYPWGPANIAQAGRPRPHRVSTFDSPEKQADQIAKLLKEALKASLNSRKAPKPDDVGADGDYDTLLAAVKKLRTELAADALKAVEEIRAGIEGIVSGVFKDYKVTLDARPEEDLESAIDLVAGTPVVRMGPTNGFQAPVSNQGSGARRTLLWAALRILAERPTVKPDASTRTHLLLMDEPELCLHPDAIREARRVLYDLPKNQSWQVMITTHSPVFIDLSENNTSIVRVERLNGGTVQGTTIFRPRRAKLDDDDRAELKLLNMCDPHVAEFFFGGRTVVVEGDTEYSAFRYVASSDPERYGSVHIVRARGKACIVSLCKILDQFDKSYAVLHDSDRPTVMGLMTKKERKNPAWTENEKILAGTAVARASGRVRLLTSIPNFEEAFFGEVTDGEKPYGAIARLRSDDEAFRTVRELLDALIDHSAPVPGGALEWTDLDALAKAVDKFDSVVDSDT